MGGIEDGGGRGNIHLSKWGAARLKIKDKHTTLQAIRVLKPNAYNPKTLIPPRGHPNLITRYPLHQSLSPHPDDWVSSPRMIGRPPRPRVQ